jgi:catechol 2,3-dioxygenase-like lactoylglutathione lyase family enzyme
MKKRIELDGVSHLTMPIHDLKKAERFYVDLLGAKLVHKMDREEFLKLRPGRVDEADAENSPLHLTLSVGDECEIQLFLQPFHIRQYVLQPHPHFAIHVDPDQLLPAKEILISNGVPVEGPLRLGPPGHASIYFFDPFGNHLELETMGYEGDAPIRIPDHSRLPYTWE